MRQTDENFISMSKAVRDVLEKHTNVWTANAAFNTQAGLFLSAMTAIDLAMEGAQIVSTGATDDKANAELVAIKLGVNLAKRASVYALNTGNVELHDQLRVSKSTLLRRPDTLTVAKLRDIRTRIEIIMSQLGDYGVTTNDLTAFESAINAFDALIARSRVLIVERKGYNQATIPELLAELREVLYKLDSLINIFSGTELATAYKDARIIVDLGSSKTPPVGSV